MNCYNYLKIRRFVQLNTWNLENRSSILRVKRGCEANLLATIPSSKGTRKNVLKYIKRLVLLGVLGVANYSEWGDPFFSQHKPKSNQVHFLSDLRNLNKQLKHKTYPMPKINEILLKLEVFQYAKSLDLNTG